MVVCLEGYRQTLKTWRQESGALMGRTVGQYLIRLGLFHGPAIDKLARNR